MNFCVDCKHFQKSTRFMDQCKSPRNSRDKVTGEREVTLCVFNRASSSTKCGTQGTWFEQKVEVPIEVAPIVNKPKNRFLAFFGFGR